MHQVSEVAENECDMRAKPAGRRSLSGFCMCNTSAIVACRAQNLGHMICDAQFEGTEVKAGRCKTSSLSTRHAKNELKSMHGDPLKRDIHPSFTDAAKSKVSRLFSRMSTER